MGIGAVVGCNHLVWYQTPGPHHRRDGPGEVPHAEELGVDQAVREGVAPPRAPGGRGG